MKKNSNIINIVLIMLISVVMFIFTMYSRDESGMLSKGNIINNIFLLFMTVGILFITTLYLGRAVKMTNDLRNAAKYLREEGSWRDITFSSKHLSNAFLNYCNDMNPSKGLTIDCDISDYINTRMLNQAVQKNLCESVSASMTGFGMLGTFLGLIIGLHGFSTNYSEMQNSIMILLNGMKTAFLTSIYGVTFSLIFNYVYRKIYHNMTNALDEFHEEFYRNAVGNVQEDVNRRLVASQEKQTQNIEKIMVSFERSLNEISSNMSDKLENYLNILNRGVVGQLEQSLSIHIEHSRRMVEEYLKNMNDNVLETQLQKLDKILNNYEAFSMTSLQNSAALKTVADSLTEQHKGFKEANKSMFELTNILTESALSLKEYQTAVAESQLEYSRKLLEHKEYMDEITAAFNEKVAEYMGSIEKANTTFDLSAKSLDISVQNVAAGNAELLAAITRNEKQLEITGSQLEGFLTSANELTERVKQNSYDLTNYYNTVKEASVNVVESIHTALLDDVQTGSEQLRLLNEELNQSSASLSQTYRDLNDGLDDTFKQFDRNTADIAEQFTDMLENIRNTADYIPVRLNDALKIYFDEHNLTNNSDETITEDGFEIDNTDFTIDSVNGIADDVTDDAEEASDAALDDIAAIGAEVWQ